MDFTTSISISRGTIDLCGISLKLQTQRLDLLRLG